MENSSGSGYFIGTGEWSPRPGVAMNDAIFPHVQHGFRGKNLPFVTFHVSGGIIEFRRITIPPKIIYPVNCTIYFQNPPWQIINPNKTGPAKFDGLVFDILKQLSLRLNFTYNVMILSADEVRSNFQRDSSVSSKVNFLSRNLLIHLLIF